MSSIVPHEMVGRTFGDRYRVLLPVAPGIIADVFVAEDLDTGERVSLKVFDQSVGEDPAVAERVVDAVSESAMLEHANIVTVYDWGVDGVRVWVASELAWGSSLRAMLDLGRRLSPSQALVMALEVSRALSYAHGLGLSHRRLRPENIVFTEAGNARLSDFGLANALTDSSIVRASRAVDAVRHLAPEQAQRRVVDDRCDIYALGLIIDEAVTGVAPPAADTAIGTMILRAESPIVPGAELGPLRPPIERCGSIQPTDRPEAGELTIALLAAAESMSRPAELDVVPLPGLDRLDPASGSDAAETAGLGKDEGASGPSQVEVRGLGDPNSGAVSLVAVPDPGMVEVPDVGDRVALEDLDTAAPAFADAADPADADDGFDAPAEALVPGAAGYAPEPDDADDQLPKWPLGVLVALVAGVAALVLAFGGSGGGATAVPDLVGLDRADAIAAVETAGLTVEGREGRSNGSQPGEVLAQDPAAGTELAPGGQVAITVSLGSEMVEIPADVVGLTVEQATARLQAVGLDVGAFTEERSELVDAGLVVGIGEPTRQLPLGDGVDLRLSLGPIDRTVPDTIIGVPIQEATTALTALRLQGVEEQVYDPEAEVGTVLNSSPLPGDTVPADSQVTLFVSAGPEPVELPDLAGATLAEAYDILEQTHGMVVIDTQGAPGDPVLETIPAAGEIVDVGSEIVVVLGEPEDEDADEE